LNPGTARRFAENGWTKKDIASFIAEYVLMNKYANPEDPIPGVSASQQHIEKLRERSPLFPQWLRIMVGGGTISNYNAMIVSGGFPSAGSWVTQKIELPANWDKLVKKYKDIVPKYGLY